MATNRPLGHCGARDLTLGREMVAPSLELCDRVLPAEWPGRASGKLDSQRAHELLHLALRVEQVRRDSVPIEPQLRHHLDHRLSSPVRPYPHRVRRPLVATLPPSWGRARST